METKTKIELVLGAIKDQLDLSPEGASIILSQEKNDGLDELTFEDYVSILKKLQNDYKIIKIESLAEYKPSIMTHSDPFDYRKDVTVIQVLGKFDEFYNQYTGYSSAPASTLVPASSLPSGANKNQELLRITFTKTREILMNDIFLLCKPESFGENEDLFAYLYKHQNEELEIEDIEKNLNRKFEKPISKILENLGFRKGLRDAFFALGNGKILFKNPISANDLAESGVRIPITIR